MILKIHGRGNAWPVPLGEEHPFYDRSNPADLSNAAFSLIIEREKGDPVEILVDAGHGTIQSLVSGNNRIPDTICLTHGHMDHTLSVDWVVQSFWSRHNKTRKYPLYSSLPVYRFLIQSFPHLEKLIAHQNLLPGKPVKLFQDPEIILSYYPVYHGQSAYGAGMLLFTYHGERILFTGDLLTPLLRMHDYEDLTGVDMMVVDANNRFPYPGTNHWSVSGDPVQPMKKHKRLKETINELSPDNILRPHAGHLNDSIAKEYFELIKNEYSPDDQCFTIFEFARRIKPQKIMPVHYSGREDEKYYKQQCLNSSDLSEWINNQAAAANIGSEFIIPGTGLVYAIT